MKKEKDSGKAGASTKSAAGNSGANSAARPATGSVVEPRPTKDAAPGSAASAASSKAKDATGSSGTAGRTTGVAAAAAAAAAEPAPPAAAADNNNGGGESDEATAGTARKQQQQRGGTMQQEFIFPEDRAAINRLTPRIEQCHAGLRNVRQALEELDAKRKEHKGAQARAAKIAAKIEERLAAFESERQAIIDDVDRESKRRQAKFTALDDGRKALAQRWPARTPMSMGSGGEAANLDRLDDHIKALESRQMQTHEPLSLAAEKKLIQDIAAARALRNQLKEHYQQVHEHAADRAVPALKAQQARLEERHNKDRADLEQFQAAGAAAQAELDALQQTQQELIAQRQTLQQQLQAHQAELDAVRAKIEAQRLEWKQRREAERQEAQEKQRAKQDARLKRDSDRLEKEARHAPYHKEVTTCSSLLQRLQITLARCPGRKPTGGQQQQPTQQLGGKSSKGSKTSEPQPVQSIDLELLVQFESLSLLPPRSLGVGDLRSSMRELRLKLKWLYALQRQLVTSDHPEYPPESAEATLDEQEAAEEAAEAAAAAAAAAERDEEPARATPQQTGPRNKVVEISEEELLLIIQSHERQALLDAVTRQTEDAQRPNAEAAASRRARKPPVAADHDTGSSEQEEAAPTIEEAPALDSAPANEQPQAEDDNSGAVSPPAASPPRPKKTPLPAAVLERIRQLTLEGASFEEIQDALLQATSSSITE